MITNDLQLRRDVEAELDWHQRLDSRQIGVARSASRQGWPPGRRRAFRP